MTLRRACADDVPALVRIRASVRENVLSDPAKVPAEAYLSFIEHAAIWLWEQDGQPAGFAASDPADGTVWALFVEPAAEGRGIGRRLLQRALADLRAAGWPRARLSTEPGSRAERFYREDGWREAGRAVNGDLLLERDL